MRRVSLAMAMALGFGLSLTGCGETAETPPAPTPSAGAKAETGAPPTVDTKNEQGGGKPGGGSSMPPGYQPPPGTDGPGGKPVHADDKDKKDAEPKKEGDPKTASVTLSKEEMDAIKELPAEDQAAALAQKVCLVGEDEGKPNHLGSMGKPVKKVIKGKTIFLCCEGCVKDLEQDPDKYLSKLGK